MHCPYCNADTTVTRTRLSEDGLHVMRDRRCKAPLGHRFETSEQDMLRPDQIGVRQSGSQDVAGSFDVKRLRRDIQDALYYSAKDPAQRGAADDVARGVERALLTRRDLFDKRSTASGALPEKYRHVILDRRITELVEDQLQGPELRVQKVLYALYARGRGDRKGRDGWDAAGALAWLQGQYPEMRVGTVGPRLEVREFMWHPPSTVPMPRTVLKRNRHPTDFVYEQFVRSIRKALLGRREAEVTAERVATWVLDSLGGQARVHSMQLAVGVLECLRRVDDIAFLRASIIVKGLDNVSAIAEEALSLVRSPSPRLRFGLPTIKEVASGEPLVS